MLDERKVRSYTIIPSLHSLEIDDKDEANNLMDIVRPHVPCQLIGY